MSFSIAELATMTPDEVRHLIRTGAVTEPTAGMCKGHLQGNLAILPKKLAYDFLLFAQRNPKSCPLLEVTDVGSYEPKLTAPGADIRTDVPKYRVYRYGELVEETSDITAYWQPDFVAFVIGCSFSFETALMEAGIPVRHIQDQHNVPMYLMNRQATPAGIFHGRTVVSMRPIPHQEVVRAVTITARFPAVHNEIVWRRLVTSVMSLRHAFTFLSR